MVNALRASITVICDLHLFSAAYSPHSMCELLKYTAGSYVVHTAYVACSHTQSMYHICGLCIQHAAFSMHSMFTNSKRASHL